MHRRRVVVTGMGVESCIGRDLETFWSSLRDGRSGIRPITRFDASDFGCKVAGEVDLDPLQFMPAATVRRSSRFQQLLYCAVAKALDHRGHPQPGARIGLVVGTGGGGEPALGDHIESMRLHGWRGIDRLSVLKSMPSMAAGLVAQSFGVRGPVLTVCNACASSTDAIGLATQMIRSGQVDIAIAAGVEAWITEAALAGFCQLQAVSTRPALEAAAACRPFDADRDGLVPSEGAGAVILEALEPPDHVKALAEIAGYGSSCDGHHLVQPEPEGRGALDAMTMALADAGLSPSDIDHINAHGTSTRINDAVETRAVAALLEGRAAQVPMTANKSILGHASGASGVLEVIATVLAMQRRFIPPTINLATPDPACWLDYTANHGRQTDIRTALKVSFGFGGQNAALVLRRDAGGATAADIGY